MKRVAGWIKPSNRQRDENRQRSVIDDYCLNHEMVVSEWIEGVEMFGDVAFGKWMSGKKIDAVVVADSSLVSGEFFEYYAYKCVLMRRHSDLVAVSGENFSGYKLYGTILEEFIGTLCRVELENEPIRKPHDRVDKAARGAYIGGNAPMGYRVEGGKLVVNPEEVPVVELVMERKHQGKTMLSTVEALNAGGYKTRRGNPFVISTVQSIWNNEPFYRGMYRHGKDGEWVPGQHEAILKDR